MPGSWVRVPPQLLHASGIVRTTHASLRSSLAVAALVGVALACRGEGPPPRPTVARVDVSATALTLKPGETRTLTASAVDARGNVLTTEPIRWASANPTIADVSSAGMVQGIAPGSTTLTARAGTATTSIAVQVERLRVARILFPSGTPDLVAGASTSFTALGIDAEGRDALGWLPQWSTDDPSIATVDANGVVLGVRGGTTTLRVRMDTATAAVELRVLGAIDLAVTGLTFVQVVQDDAGTVPMVRGGLPVAAIVYVTADARVSTRAWVRVRCSEGGVVRWEDSVRVDTPLGPAPLVDAPAAQFLMPNDRLGASQQCVAEADPAALLPDAARANNRFPRTGALEVQAITVPPLEISFIPIVLAADGGVTGNVTSSNLEQYLPTVRQLHPVGAINARVGQSFTTTTQFGGGGDAAWRSILRDLEAKRTLDGYRGHYYGVVRPGAGVTFVQYGGFGYVTGRTAMSIQVGWFNREESARELVAHELGHNFGRPHAPCGGAASPDMEYPYADAAIGVTGWDVFSVSATNPRAGIIPSAFKDLMSYCKPVWISDYTYRKVIAGREFLASVGRVQGGEAVLVRGELGDGATVVDPVFVVDAAPTGQAMQGVDLELLDAAGQVLVRHRAPLLAPDHGGFPSFVAAIAVAGGAERVAAVRVRGASGRVTERRLDAQRGPVPLEVRQAGTRTRITWDVRAAPQVLVRDEATGELLAIAGGGTVEVPRGASALRAAFSNGWRTRVVR